MRGCDGARASVGLGFDHYPGSDEADLRDAEHILAESPWRGPSNPTLDVVVARWDSKKSGPKTGSHKRGKWDYLAEVIAQKWGDEITESNLEEEWRKQIR